MQQAKYPITNYLHLLGLVFLKTVSKIFNLQKIYNNERARHIEQTGLFDRVYYLTENHDVAESGIDPLLHYVVYGDKEDRKPSLLFDPRFYRQHAKKFKFIEVNTLLHYFAIGRYKNISPSQWIDIKYYLLNNRDVKLNGIEPLTHYINYGGFEGRAANPHFDSQFYLVNYPDVKASNINPLIHYVLYGQAEGRKTKATNYLCKDHSDTNNQHDVGKVLPIDDINIVPKQTTSALVDVIIPVYENRILTLQCIVSVLQATTDIAYELIVINDCSPNAEISQDLNTMAEKKWFTLITNESNKGFVYSANKGISLHPDRDIVVLNSDTEVYDFWLDRLRDVAYSRSNVASVTPISNNATICSYPRFLYDNPYPLEISYAELDKIASIVNKDIIIETPTGVGFCMYMCRTVIENIGGFDEETFGKGYGEENDWCQRALNNGNLNLLAPNVFVRHFGNASFKEEKNNRVKDAMHKLSRIYPKYEQDIKLFIQKDALYDARNRLDWARLERQKQKVNIIIFCHNRGGGTARFIQETTAKFNSEDTSVFFMFPALGKPTHIRLVHQYCEELISIPAEELSNLTQISVIIKKLEISEIHIHGLVDFDSETPIHLTSISKNLNIPLHIYIHDYTFCCPRVNLIDENGLYCGEPDDNGCNKCLTKRGNEFDVKNISVWRSNNYKMLQSAKFVQVPNIDVAERLYKYFPEIKINTKPHHIDVIRTIHYSKNKKNHSTKLRVVVIGAIGKMKGFDILLACATEVKIKQLPIEFILMGYSMNDTALKKQNVVITGKYDDVAAEQVLSDIDADIVWLPSLWPETFCYTLSIALKTDLPIVAFDIGAIANRLKTLELDQFLMPLNLANQPQAVIQKLLNHLEI